MTNNDETPGDKREAELVNIIRQNLYIPAMSISVDMAIEMEKTQALAIARAILAKQTSEVGERPTLEIKLYARGLLVNYSVDEKLWVLVQNEILKTAPPQSTAVRDEEAL